MISVSALVKDVLHRRWEISSASETDIDGIRMRIYVGARDNIDSNAPISDFFDDVLHTVFVITPAHRQDVGNLGLQGIKGIIIVCIA